MSITLQVNNERYGKWKSAAINISLDQLCNTFRFDATSALYSDLPFSLNDDCEVYVNDEKVLTGRIERIDVSYSSDNHLISISGRDLASDIVDSTLDTIGEIAAPVSLKQIIERVIKNIGSSLTVSVAEGTTIDDFIKAEDISQAKPGDMAFGFIEKYARKRQVILTSDADGNVVITQNNLDKIDGQISHQKPSINNNVISADFSDDATSRFNIYKVMSGQNPPALNFTGGSDLNAVVNQSGRIIGDQDIPRGRQLILTAETPMSQEQCLNRADWEKNVRASRARVYGVRVKGFSYDRISLWPINKLVHVVDDYANLDEQMLINNVTYSLSVNGGSITDLQLVDRNSYRLIKSETIPEEKSDSSLFGGSGSSSGVADGGIPVSGNNTDHAVLANRFADDQHSQSAITDLVSDQATQDQNLIDHETDPGDPHDQYTLKVDGLNTWALASYGSIGLNTPYAIGAVNNNSWVTLQWDTLLVQTPKGVVQDLVGNALTLNYEGIWLCNMKIALTFTEVNAGRQIQLRFWNNTDMTTDGTTFNFFVGRNQSGVTLPVGVLFQNTANTVGDKLQVQVAGADGDSFSNVQNIGSTYSFHNVGEAQFLLP